MTIYCSADEDYWYMFNHDYIPEKCQLSSEQNTVDSFTSAIAAASQAGKKIGTLRKLQRVSFIVSHSTKLLEKMQ